MYPMDTIRDDRFGRGHLVYRQIDIDHLHRSLISSSRPLLYTRTLHIILRYVRSESRSTWPFSIPLPIKSNPGNACVTRFDENRQCFHCVVSINYPPTPHTLVFLLKSGKIPGENVDASKQIRSRR